MTDPDPTILRIGALDFAVCSVRHPEDYEHPYNAKIDHSTCTIEVDVELGDQVRRVTIWHEVLHTILAQAGILDHDESQLRALSYGIVAALRDNPSLCEVADE